MVIKHVLGMMNTSAKLEKILAVNTQVVAGTNYAIDFKLNDDQNWNTRIFRSFNDKFTTTQNCQ
ncbi:cystatin domain-containing protein [Aliivibrio sp. S3MY1]|uniref:cystatin domain-containing protein n=1 Tax=unclassified Aliivibrio TaxID=2645654 RepID=UPI002379D0D8|nr:MULTISPECIES: cystatin domain-containing protein [unclassified Aliivibrio]MDD9194803.1 cystatin domain-containing protein [Aliivibrio sp. S3MY1]MDD9198656.1 cystatin domain-containing protein [Aliivibrio sp. S2MY1]